MFPLNFIFCVCVSCLPCLPVSFLLQRFHSSAPAPHSPDYHVLPLQCLHGFILPSLPVHCCNLCSNETTYSSLDLLDLNFCMSSLTCSACPFICPPFLTHPTWTHPWTSASLCPFPAVLLLSYVQRSDRANTYSPVWSIIDE